MLRSHARGVFVFTCLALPGCGKQPEVPGPDPAPGIVSGNVLYDQHCLKCHNFNVSTDGPKKKGPNLYKVADDPTHTADWIAEHIRNPRSHQPRSTMPPFADQLSPED